MDTPHQTLKRAQEYRTVFLDYLQIVLGTFLMALSFAIFFLPRDIAPGGITGLATIIASFRAINVGLLSFMINLPLFAAGWKVVSLRFAIRSFLAMTLLSVFIDILPHVDISGDMMLASVFGGIVEGVGLGLVVRGGATTGGTDMVAALIQSRMRHYSVVQIMQVMDAAIVIAGLYVFGLRSTLYAVVSIFVMTKVSDAFLEGFKNSKAALIITNHHEEVAQRLMDELDRGVTGMDAKGMYTQNYKCVLYCVVSRKEIVRLKEIVNDVDPEAFVIVSDVREVLGEGFMEYSSQDF